MSAHAGIVSTQETMASSASAANRAYVAAFLARDEVRAGLLSQGVDIDAAT